MKVYTTGQVAKICGVVPRTVAKWIDSGCLRGYRIPGGEDRRVPQQHLVAFLKKHGMPLGIFDILESIRVLVVSRDERLFERMKQEASSEFRFEFALAGSGFEAGSVAVDFQPHCVVLDFSIGMDEAATICCALRDNLLLANSILVALLPDDESYLGVDRKSFKDLFRKPFDMALFAERLRTLVIGRLESTV